MALKSLLQVGMLSPQRSAAADIGTVNTLIAVKGRGIVLREPSVVAVSTDNAGEVLACGNAAIELAAHPQSTATLVWPLKDGVIADCTLASAMLGLFLRKAFGSRTGALGARLALCTPLEVSDIERRALETAAKAAGAGSVLVAQEPIAAALGAKLPVFEPRGSMIIDIGGGTSDIAVLALGGVAAQCSLRHGGRSIDKAIQTYIQRQYSLFVSERTAEDVKLTLARATPGGIERMQVKGRNVESGLPAYTVLNSGEISRALMPWIRVFGDSIKQVLRQTPPELAGDLLHTGITLTGGGALLPGLARLIATQTGLRVSVAPNAMDCVALGALELLSMPDAFGRARLA